MSRGKATGGTVNRSPTDTPFGETPSDEERRLLTEISRAPRAAEPCWALFRESIRIGHRGHARWAIDRLQLLCADNAQSWSAVAAAYADLESWSEAANALRRAVAQGAIDEKTLAALANMMLADDRADDARAALRALTQHHPTAAITHLTAGHICKAEGDLRSAVTSYRRAIESQPNLADALFHLVELDDTDDPTLATVITNALSVPGVTAMDAATLRFAMARIDHRAARRVSAFQNWSQANALTRQQLSDKGIVHDPIRHEQAVTAMIAATPRSALDPALPPLPMGMRPIFIVGMPRSGTTLVDQIIGKHPLVQQSGELTAMPACVARFLRRRSELGVDTTEPWGSMLDRDLLMDAREGYLEQVLRRGIEAEVFTDKLPANFENIGMIRLLFPEAIIVHCRRHPVANCWSLFTTNLVGHEAYQTSMRDIVDVYRHYRRLMSHWRSSGTQGLIDLDHETLVTNPDSTMPWLLEKCGLAWDDACRSFQDSSRAVVTASAAQVRRGLDMSSLTGWLDYREFIEPEIIDSLMELADFRA